MKVKIIESLNQHSWATAHIGEEFEVLESLDHMMPRQYKVDISRLVTSGEVAESSRGIGYLFASDVEVVAKD